ncbi:MAG: hypothetical protein ACRCWY_08385 [Cellulosilyticaceae bacterium]
MKLRLLAAAVLSLAVFTGCSSAEPKPETKPETETVAPEKEEEATEEGVEVKKSEIEQEKGTLVTEITFKDGTPVDVQIDILEDGKSKYELAAKGEYVMVEGSDNTWDKQVDALEAFIVENNFDLTKITQDENGNTDAISGVSIKVPSLLVGVEEILAQ